MTYYQRESRGTRMCGKCRFDCNHSETLTWDVLKKMLRFAAEVQEGGL